MSNIIDSIQLSGITYQIEGSGGGKAIEAGRGIAITTGETADTVSFNLPISAGTGTNSIAEGYNTTASGDYGSHAEGQGTTASAWYSHAEGYNTTADGGASHAEGAGSSANAFASHAEGYNTTTNGDYSHAEGNDTTANGSSSHAEGTLTQAMGGASHAEGNHTTANGNYSHTEGLRTIANNKSEHASGQYNNSVSASTTFGDSGNTLFSVGNGTSSSAKHNAFEIRQNGDIYISSGGTDIKLQDHLGGGSVTVDDELSPTSENPVQNKVIYDKIDEVEEVTAAGLNALNDKITPTVELTQAEYDALTTKDPNTYYIITDAQAGDLTNYYTKTETNTLLGGKQATLVSGTNIKTINNESILGSGNIDIQGGGKAIEAGRGITITTGETADTINCTLSGGILINIANNKINCQAPIRYGTGSNNVIVGSSISTNKSTGFNSIANGGDYNTASGQYSYAEGHYTTANGNTSHSEGWFTIASGNYSHTEGNHTKTTNESEHASGKYNASSSASTTFGDSGNTLFSVGNGTADNARHNAFEIRQNGDIYLTKDGQDVKLQDQLGGSSITVDTSLDSGSTNPVENRVIYNKIDEVEQVTAAGLNALNDNFGGLKLVKLSEAEYNALATKDSNTLYIVI